MKCTITQKDRIASYKKCCDYIFQNNGIIPDSQGVHIVWCHTHHLMNLINCIRLQNNVNIQYIIVSHASDYGITQNVIDCLPSNIIKVFGQNICVDKNPRVESIPIGCIGSTWIGNREDATTHQDSGVYCDNYCNIPETGEEKQYKNLLLVDFNVNTNPPARMPVYDYFKNKSWATVNPCTLSFEEHSKTKFHSEENYFKEVYNHKFTASPLGNGVDCGRNWHSLYLGTIPIIPRHPNIEYYENSLPFLIYDDINTLTEEYLNKKWNEMSTKKYNLEKATITYWTNRIKGEKNNIISCRN